MRRVRVWRRRLWRSLALGACGKPRQSNAPEAPTTTPTEPASAPAAAPAPLTDAQKKTLLAELPAAYQSADLSNGEAKFAVCAACHTPPRAATT